MRIAILDYNSGRVTIIQLPAGITQSEQVEAWMDGEGLQVSNCQWMEVKSIRVEL